MDQILEQPVPVRPGDQEIGAQRGDQPRELRLHVAMAEMDAGLEPPPAQLVGHRFERGPVLARLLVGALGPEVPARGALDHVQQEELGVRPQLHRTHVIEQSGNRDVRRLVPRA